MIRTSKLIDRSKTLPADSPFDNTIASPQYGNSDGFTIHGGEIEWQHYPIDNLNYFVNLTYQEGKWNQTGKRYQFIAPLSGNIGVSWQIFWLIRASLYMQVIGGRSGYLVDGTHVQIKPYFLGNINFTLTPVERLEISVILHNFTNQGYAYPEYIRRRLDHLPGGPGIGVFGQIQYIYPWGGQ
jgi:outer membrane receptor protein involved in Fe transport